MSRQFFYDTPLMYVKYHIVREQIASFLRLNKDVLPLNEN
jgi:hypothetical protein